MEFKFDIVQATSDQWKKTIVVCKSYDFYHTAAYQKLSSENSNPLLLVAIGNKQTIALPILIRDIEGTEYKDVTSVYGYCGPIASVDFTEVENELLQFFKKNIKSFFDEVKVISAFSRLHPLIDTHTFFNDLGDKIPLNKTVSIDLSLEVDEQRRKFRKSNKSELNQLRRKGITVVEVTTQEDVDTFIKIYEDTMKRVNAAEMYFFSKTYYNDFLNNDEFESKLLVAKIENTIIAGAIFTVTGEIMQYHLAGTAEEHMKITPMKLILDEARLLANSLGLSFLHLGGGVGGSDEDSLFRFKSGFSDYYSQFYIWKYIHDGQVYNKLVDDFNVSDKTSKFFPLYRSID